MHARNLPLTAATPAPYHRLVPRLVVPVALALLGVVVDARSAQADDRPPFQAQVAAARKAKIGCKDLTLNSVFVGDEGAALIAACNKHRWPLEWIVCEIDEYGGCERHLSPAQRKQRTAALARPTPKVAAVAPSPRGTAPAGDAMDLLLGKAPPRPAPTASPVRSKQVTVDRIAITRGSLDDGGAGAARWAHRTLEGCVERKHLGPQTGTIYLVGGAPLATAELSVTGADPLRRCLEGRRSQLVWTDDTHDVNIEMRVTIRR